MLASMEQQFFSRSQKGKIMETVQDLKEEIERLRRLICDLCQEGYPVNDEGYHEVLDYQGVEVHACSARVS